MGIIRDISNWYFSKKALPYWCILLLDCIIVVSACYASTYLFNGGDYFASNFWQITWGLVVTAAVFCVFFRLFHTYSGVIRFSSFIDLQKLSTAMFCGCASCAVLSLVWNAVAPGVSAVILPDWKIMIFAFFVGTLLMWITRVLVKSLYDVIRTDQNTSRIFVYGVREGGIGLVKSMRSESPIRYSPVGFVSPDGEMDGAWLLGLKVYPDDDSLVEAMERARADFLFVSPLQTEHFRSRDSLIDSLLQSGIRIMMMPAVEEWDGKSELGHTRLKEVQIEDLLPRDKITVDMKAIGSRRI